MTQDPVAERAGNDLAVGGEGDLPADATAGPQIEPQRGLHTAFLEHLAAPAEAGPPWPVLVATEDLGTRLRGVPPEWVDAAAAAGLRVIVQADGSGRRPFKAPADHEPV
ncbi:MAG: hypothetical protein ACREKH_01690, partial [Candidatus Rokuibacteriota bacterium]